MYRRERESDPALGAQIYAKIIEPRIIACIGRIEKAQSDDEIRGDVPAVDIVELIYAPLYYRLLLHSREITTAQVDRVLEPCFPGNVDRAGG